MMYAIVSAAIKGRSSASPSLHIISGKENNTIQNEGRESVPAPSRFAVAQQLFRRQQTVPPKLPSPPFIPPNPTSPCRHRSFTASSSLYSKLEQSIQSGSISPEERATAVSSPEKTSFTESFGQPRPQHVIRSNEAEAPRSRPQISINTTCILSGPKYTSHPFDITAIKGTTATGKAAWWCRHDRLVIFDGLKPENEHHKGRHYNRLLVRTSKGLEMARKNCPKEVIHVDIPCTHCRDALGKKIWMYEARVKRSRICKKCQEKCWTEVEAQRDEAEFGKVEVVDDTRRDSFLMQGDVVGEEKGVRKIQSERNLKVNVSAEALKTEDPTYVEVTPDLRKVRSDQQLHRAAISFIDEILFVKSPPPQT